VTRTARVGLDALLTPEESILVLIDHQPFQRMHLWVVRVGDPRSAVSHGAVTE